MADEPVTCPMLTTILKNKYHLGMEDIYQVNQACKTGIQMKSDGISEIRFAAFLQKAVTDNDEMGASLKRATEESLVAGYDGVATLSDQ